MPQLSNMEPLIQFISSLAAVAAFPNALDISPATCATCDTGVAKRSASCEPVYAEISKFHTNCREDKGTIVPLEDSYKQLILDKHNQLRREVNPPAADLMKLTWNDELAVTAAKWAAQCNPDGHDENHHRLAPKTLPGVYIGQNIALGDMCFIDAIYAWYDEVNFYTYGNNTPTEAGMKIGHYTQLVGHLASQVGCGEAECTGTYKKVQVCNYARGQDGGDIANPYTLGSPCNSCPDHCVDNLCDCGGKTCLNGGTIDPNTCTCTCKDPFLGDICGHALCNDEPEHGYCSTVTRSDCYTNMQVRSICLQLCGLCPSVCPESERCENGAEQVVGSPCTCKCFVYSGDLSFYSGPTCGTLTCPDEDPVYCGTGFVEAKCSDYYNLPFMCPIKCGQCSGNGQQSTCGGKTCQNDGTLNTTTCECACVTPFTGDTCQTACGGKTCLNGGTLNTTTCDCACVTPFTGDTCQTACGGKTCLNGGTLNTTTCDCACVTPFTGDTCQTACRGKTCLNGDTLNTTTCECVTPSTGDTCQTACGGKTCLNGGTLNTTTCDCACVTPFTGDTCQTEVTFTADPLYCNNKRPRACSRIPLVKQHCHQLCGQSPDNCCKNGGQQLSSTPCRCNCVPYTSHGLSFFSGPTCDMLTCPSADPCLCDALDPSKCDQYWNMPYICPVRCGICPLPK